MVITKLLGSGFRLLMMYCPLFSSSYYQAPVPNTALPLMHLLFLLTLHEGPLYDDTQDSPSRIGWHRFQSLRTGHACS